MRTATNFWDERYASEEYFYGTSVNDFLAANMGLFRPGQQILSLGEGEGRNAVFLAERGVGVTAVDGSALGLKKMQRLASSKGLAIEAQVADLQDYDLGTDRWDGIISIWCHLPSALRRDVHRRCVAALKPGGMFLLESYTPRQLAFKTGGPSDVDLLPTYELLRDELSGLSLVWASEVDRVVEEGAGHHGMSAVIQYIARKI